MSFPKQLLEYKQIGYFNQLITDYLSGNKALQSFYKYPVSINGIKIAIKERKNYNTDRKLLVDELQKQYSTININEKAKANIELLLNENTFTICTAHQPNIFTGPLYFIYKILHVVKISASLKEQLPEYNFVPVYYMGSEDADLDELGHIFMSGEKYEWNTHQTGAVGRMKVDKALLKLIESIEGRLLVYPFGREIIDTIKASYKEGTTIEQATFKLVNELFAEYGLIILLPDNSSLKRKFIPVVEKELNEAFSHKAVAETIAAFPSEYKVQASGRELNLFYLKDDKRERIEKINSKFQILNSKLNKDEIIKELYEHPERFSPNVILRPVFQELILPNILFVGGAGEIGYWLELKKVFEAANVLYPMLVVRNSFLYVRKERDEQTKKLQLSSADLFKDETILLNELVKKESKVQLTLEKEKQQLTELYQQLKNITSKVDVTLSKHTEALQTQALKKIEALEKKMLKAEKKKFEAQQRQLHKLKSQLFPNNNLQERIDNILLYYAKHGNNFIKLIYENSLTLEQQFTIIKED